MSIDEHKIKIEEAATTKKIEARAKKRARKQTLAASYF